MKIEKFAPKTIQKMIQKIAPKLIALVIVPLAVSAGLSSSAFAAGTGTGNGADGARAAYIAKLKAELSVGLQNHADNPDLNSIYDWCARVTSMLRREKQRALLQIQADHLDLAEQILKDALIVASQSMEANPNLGSPLTKRMINRGVIYVDGIEGALEADGSATRLDRLTELDFMTGFIDLIIEAEARLDRPYYIPFHYQYGRCADRCPPEFDFRAFCKRYLDYAKAELAFVVNHSVNQDWRDGQLVVTPIGKPEAFLKLAELSTGLLADEIAQTLQAYRNACMIVDLKNLSEILQNFNLFGDRTYFPNMRYAVSGTAAEIQRILGQANSGFPIGTGPGMPPITQELLRSGPLYLSNGDMRSIRLGEPRFIQKIFVQAEATYRDAVIEVIVGGEVKGTIYLPARDPSYVVTIAEAAGSIELRQVSGSNVTVRSVLAVFN